jgi:MFS family permease
LSNHDRRASRAVFQFRDFRLFVGLSCIAVIVEQMLEVAIGWELYERTNSAFSLGLVGLVQVVPVVLLALPAGHVVDRYDRKLVAFSAFAAGAVAALGLLLLSASEGPLWLVYGCLAFIGAARGFQSPALSVLGSQVVPPEYFEPAAKWENSLLVAVSIGGPAAGGLLISVIGDATPIYAITAVGLLAVAGLTVLLRPRPVAQFDEPMSVESLFAGLAFIRATKVMHAAFTLDLFAVLLGGATALLPIFAKDVLGVGASGLGWLRAAPAIGAVVAGLALAHARPFERAGRVLLLVVGGFGVATIAFGLSRSFWLSLTMLAVLGALDNVSGVIRATLLLTNTPDQLRGRVNSVESVFIGLSNELGAFESGVAAALLGATGAVVTGGIGTLLVVPAIALLWPEIRHLGRLTAEPAEAEAALVTGD